MVSWLARSTSGREVAGSSLLAAGCHVATVGQLLFAPWACAYSTVHPIGVGKWVPAIAGKVRATLLGARHVPELLCGGYVYLGCYIKCSTFFFTKLHKRRPRAICSAPSSGNMSAASPIFDNLAIEYRCAKQNWKVALHCWVIGKENDCQKTDRFCKKMGVSAGKMY